MKKKNWKNSQLPVKEIEPIETIEIKDDDDDDVYELQQCNKPVVDDDLFIYQQNMQNTMQYAPHQMMRLQFAASPFAPNEPIMYVNPMDVDTKSIFKGLRWIMLTLWSYVIKIELWYNLVLKKMYFGSVFTFQFIE